MNIKPLLQSKTFKIIMLGVAAAAVLLLVFKAGEFVGFRKAGFSYKWGDNYYRNFAGPKMGPLNDISGRNFLTGNGTYGSIIKTATSTLIVNGQDGAEKTILTAPDTIVRHFRETMSVNELHVGDKIVVIGSPNDSGQIEAKLIRVLEESTSTETSEGQK